MSKINNLRGLLFLQHAFTKKEIFTKYLNMMKELDISEMISRLKAEHPDKVYHYYNAYENASIDYELITKQPDVNVITVLDEDYPKELQVLGNKKPLILYAKGNIELLRNRGIAVVGTREPSQSSIAKEEEYIREIIKSDSTINIISGLANGCDTYAHKTTLELGGFTTAVLPCGFNYISPVANKVLAREIVECGGLLLSEYKPYDKAKKYYYVERDSIVAALSDQVLVVECTEKSGTMHTVEAALKFDKIVACVAGIIGTNSNEINVHFSNNKRVSKVYNVKDLANLVGDDTNNIKNEQFSFFDIERSSLSKSKHVAEDIHNVYKDKKFFYQNTHHCHVLKTDVYFDVNIYGVGMYYNVNDPKHTSFSEEILNFKKDMNTSYEFFNEEIIERFINEGWDDGRYESAMVAAIPTHVRHKWSFNTNKILKSICKNFNLKNAEFLVVRNVTIDKLSSNNSGRSVYNQLDSLQINPDYYVKGKNIILIDDVSTTGNSIIAAAKLLKDEGAAEVIAIVLGLSDTTCPLPEFDSRGVHKNGTYYNEEGYDKDGYKRDGYNIIGFNRLELHKNGTLYDDEGYDIHGRDKDGFYRDGYNKSGIDRNGYNRDGFDMHGYDKDGFDENGRDEDGYNRDGYDVYGRDREGYDEEGYDFEGFTRQGIDEFGFTREYYESFDVGKQVICTTEDNNIGLITEIEIDKDRIYIKIGKDIHRFKMSVAIQIKSIIPLEAESH